MPNTIRKAVITAAGHGTRQYPATSTVQKELFPLVAVDGYTKPVLQVIAEECVASGIDEICIVANPVNADAIRAHFSKPSERQLKSLTGKDWAMTLANELAALSERIQVVVQEQQEGFGHAVYQAHAWAGRDPVLVLLGDHVYLAPKDAARCPRQVIDVFERYGAPVVSVDETPEDHIYSEGVVKGEPLEAGESVAYKVQEIAEKPSVEKARADLKSPGIADGSYLTHFGIHAFPPDIFDALKYLIDHDERVKNEIQLTTAQQKLVQDSPLYVACRVSGHRFDTGVPDGMIKTQVALGLASPHAQAVYDGIATAKSLGLISE